MKQFKTVWDKTNIGENYPGITSPLTYSFIRDAYSNVYEHFIRLVGVDETTIENNQAIFENMLGYVQGEVFYNINNWYELVKLLPGYSYNKGFFENMLGPVAEKKGTTKGNNTPGMIWNNRRIIVKFLCSIIFIGPLYKNFDKEFRENYDIYKSMDLKKLDNFKLVAAFEKLQNRFFSAWTYTIVNDFRVMIYYGMLTQFVKKHFPNSSNQTLSSVYGIKNKPESIKPLKELIKIAQLIRSSSTYSALFEENSESILTKLQKPKLQRLRRKIDQYLDVFGERAFNELKLEDVNFKEKPESLIALIKQYVIYSKKDLENIDMILNTQRAQKPNYSRERLSPVNKFLFRYLTKSTQRSVYKREEYRLKRARVFNIAKSFFKEIAQRMVTAGDLEESDDIFYLYMDEVLDYVRFHRLKEDFKEVVKKRKNLLDRYEDSPLPRRVSTEGLPNRESIASKTPHAKKNFIGKSTSQGVVRKAKVVVMPKLDLGINVKGKILITETTDPGWTVLFPLLKGIIIEKGGALSHASIVARELGIPCLILQDATKMFITGNTIKLDAIKGTVTLH